MASLLRLAAILVSVWLGPSAAAAASSGVYLEHLQARAAALELSARPAWHALLHYEPNWLRPGVTSTVASDWFFRAAAGRTDPAAELDATLAAFFDERAIDPRGAPAQCVYPARFAYLDRHLAFDRSRLPEADCRGYREWRAALDPAGVRLVFPDAYLNSPASMFGHTLLRLEGGADADGAELLDYAVNFAARTGGEGVPWFAVKGLTGGYPGVFGVYPYYEKVREYAWIENRDIWSYPLALTEKEIDRLAAHLWELDRAVFDYYFLTKNCSYQLLALLEAARPSLRLTEAFRWYAMPAATVRALGEAPGLLGDPDYRPSLASTLRVRADALTPGQRRLAIAVAAGERSPEGRSLAALSERDAARVLEVAHDLAYYRNQIGAVADATFERRGTAILSARSRLAGRVDFPEPESPPAGPEAGHPAGRAAISATLAADRLTLGLRLQPAYHGLLDPAAGYAPGAQLRLLDLGLRVDPERGDVRVEDLALLDIVSLSPRTASFRPVSWRFSTGLRRRPVSLAFADEPARLGYYVEGGPGLAWGNPGQLSGFVYTLASADGNDAFRQGYAAGVGISAGILAEPTAGWRLRAEAGSVDYLAGDEGRRRWLRLDQQWPLPFGEDLALRLTAGWEAASGQDVARAELALHCYF